jgi:glutamate racemase
VQKYVTPLLHAGADAIVLGCTHYPFVIPLINDVIAQTSEPGRQIHIIDTGLAVAQQLKRRLIKTDLLTHSSDAADVTAWTTGSQSSLNTAFTQLLKMPATTIHTVATQHIPADK